MRFRIETLGQFKLIDLQAGTAIHLRSNSRLVSYVAVRAPRFVSRKVLTHELWPDADAPTANNRLRVALNKLKQIMPGAVVQEAGGLTLNLNVVECDALEFFQMVQDVGDTTRSVDEFDGLLQAFRFFTRNLGPSGFESWNKSDLAEVLDTFHKVCLRMAELGFKLRRDEVVADVCQVALPLWREDPALWKARLQAAVNLGQGEEAVTELSATKNRALLSNKDIRTLTNRILKGETEPEPGVIQFSTQESQLAAEIMKVVIASRQDLARAILSSPETVALAGANPNQMMSMLDRVVSEPHFGDEHWERCMARMVGLKAWLNDAEGVFHYGHKLVEGSTQPVILRAVWNAIGIAHSLRRQWPEAMAAVATTIEYAKQIGNEIDVLSAEGNGAWFLWLQGNYEESERRYNRSLARLKEIGTPQAEFDYSIGLGYRAFIPVMQGQWSKALQWLEECHEIRTNAPVKIPLVSLLPCLAMVRMKLGIREGVLPLLRQGFLEASETQADRQQQITFEFAACTLASTQHKAYARAVMDWVLAWRNRTNLPRAKAENDLCGLIFSGIPSEFSLAESDSPPTVGQELLRLMRHSLKE